MAYREVTITDPIDSISVSRISPSQITFDFDHLYANNFRDLDLSSAVSPGDGGGASQRPSSGFLYPRGDS